jgi:transposase
MRKVQTMSIDLAKNFIQVLGVDENRKEIFNRRVTPGSLVALVTRHMPEKIAMEACATAHYWGRKFRSLGIVEVALLPPQTVAPFRSGGKNDSNDCWAIYEASQRPRLIAVPIKTEEQQILQTWVRRREALVAERTQRINAVRAYLAEFGQSVPKGVHKFFDRISELLGNEDLLGDKRLYELLIKDISGIHSVEDQIQFFDDIIGRFAKTNPICIKLQELDGIGPITAVALVAAVVKPSNFKNGRQFAAFLGLVPRQNSTGGVTRLLGIRKDGNRYLRQLLIHGGRSVLRTAADKEDSLSRWAARKKEQKGFNKACVAVANKNARMVWAVMAQMAA